MAVTKNLINIGDANITGELSASKIIKRGGTSSLYLMADGSVSTNPNTDTNVTQSYTTSASYRPLLASYKGGSSAPSDTADTTNKVYFLNKLFTDPSTGNLYLHLSGSSSPSLYLSTNLSSSYCKICYGSNGLKFSINGPDMLAFSLSALYPLTSSLTLGTSSNVWSNLYVTDITCGKTLTVSNSIIASSDLGCNIGDDDGHAFNEIHAATLHLASKNDEDAPTHYDDYTLGGKIIFGDGSNTFIGEVTDNRLTIQSYNELYLKTSNTLGSLGTIYLQPANNIVSVTGRINASTGFFQTSDINKKNVLGDLSLEKAYDLIDKCQTIIYTLKDDESNKEQIGMIAQEIQEFFPEIVSEDTDGSLSLDYSRLTVIIFKVLKDLISRISKLEERIK